MRRSIFSLLVATAVVALAATLAHRAAADDETSDVEIKIRAPLDAVSCDTTPPTITVLGLTIDVSTASFGGDSQDGTSEGTTGDQSGSDGSDSDAEDGAGGQSAGSCAALAAGQTVEVKLASDTVPLVATEVDASGDGEPEIQGPIQSVDAPNQTLTILGLVIDVSQALAGDAMSGADDNSSDGNNQPIDLTQIIAGQFAEVKLDASKLPALVATELQIKNFTNQVEVEVDDSTGQEVDDTDATGTPTDDVDVEVAESVSVQNPTGTGTQRVRKLVHLHQTTHGSFKLTGMPTGHAVISVTRVHNGVVSTGHKSVGVRGNVTRSVRMRLRSH